MSTGTEAIQDVIQWLSANTSLEGQLLSSEAFGFVVQERLSANGCSTTVEYVELLDRSLEERELLLSSVAVPETWLFRYPESFAYLHAQLTLSRGCGATALRVASIGCATGEEPYSIAMTALAAGWQPSAVRIDALEQNGALIEAARRGRFSPYAIRQGSPAWSSILMQTDADGVTADPLVRECIEFHHASALDSPLLDGTTRFDVIFCRNVMIYLNADGRNLLMQRLCASLTPQGLLFLGHAEGVHTRGMPLATVEHQMTFAFRRCASSPSVAHKPYTRQSIAEAGKNPRPGTTRGGVPATNGLRSSSMSRTEPKSTAPPPILRIEPKPAVDPAHVNGRAPHLATSPNQPMAQIGPVTDGLPVSMTETALDAAQALADGGQLAESELAVRRLHEMGRTSARGFELLATLALARNDLDDATRQLERALYLEPDRESSLLELALIHESRGCLDQATKLRLRIRRSIYRDRSA